MFFPSVFRFHMWIWWIFASRLNAQSKDSSSSTRASQIQKSSHRKKQKPSSENWQHMARPLDWARGGAQPGPRPAESSQFILKSIKPFCCVAAHHAQEAARPRPSSTANNVQHMVVDAIHSIHRAPYSIAYGRSTRSISGTVELSYFYTINVRNFKSLFAVSSRPPPGGWFLLSGLLSSLSSSLGAATMTASTAATSAVSIVTSQGTRATNGD